MNLTVRVGYNLAYGTTGQMAVLFVLKPRLEGRVLGMQVSVGRPVDLSKNLDDNQPVRLG